MRDRDRRDTPDRRVGATRAARTDALRAAIVKGSSLLLLAVPASVVARAMFFPPTFAVESIALKSQYQDAALLAKAWALPVARTFKQHVDFQPNGSICRPTSVANIFRSFDAQPSRLDAVLAGTGNCEPFGVCFGDLTLDELAQPVRDKSDIPRTGRDDGRDDRANLRADVRRQRIGSQLSTNPS